MPDYNFETLSTYDFELLARDLLQAELRKRLESFAKGRDGGIDFRFQSTDSEVVVQCKHYSDFDALYSVLKRDELQKVTRLKPKRYILVVSTALTPHRKKLLFDLLSPYCREQSDILGKEDLNNLLGIHPAIEQKNFKLWLTSTPVMEKILHGGIWGDTDLTVQRIRQRTSRYVPNRSLDRAKRILDKHHFCIIAGIPGIGKTTLAEILLLEYVDRHDFQAIRIANDLSEIKAVKNPRSRQIFYFDDFLGKTALDKLQKNEDQRLMELIEEVSANGNWRFVLTTREYILNAARLRYEVLANPPVQIKPCIVDLADYTRPIRAKILYNHIFFSDLPDPFKRALLDNKRYETILAHPNYNPRIIDHMTQFHNLANVPVHRYFEEFVKSLVNPVRIWDHAFRNQLGEAPQHVLLVMASLPHEILVGDLEIAFQAFYEYRRARLHFTTTSRDFEFALKQLDGNFIKTDLIGKDRVVAFHNPSVRDFLENYLAGTPNDVVDLFESAVFFDQFTHLWQGRRGTRFSGIQTNHQQFMEVLARGFSKPNCRVMRIQIGSQTTGVERMETSPESRMVFAIEVASDFGKKDSQHVVDQLLALLRDRAEAGDANKEDLVRLLQLLSLQQGTSATHLPIFVAAKNYLTDNLDDLEDFKSAAQFIKSFPGEIQASQLHSIGESFRLFCEGYDVASDDDPSSIRNVADDLEFISSQLDVDTDGLPDRLIEAAEEIETQNALDNYEPEDDDDWRSNTPAPDGIDDMFEGLLNEIDERSR